VTTENDRPQDVGRAHKRRGAPAPETERLLERYRAAMRRELTQLLDELEPAEVLTQASIDGTADRPVGLGLVARRERWELGIRLARELAGAIEPDPGPSTRGGSTRPRVTGAPKLTARERRSLE
jgi:hypothetical protein